MRKLLAIVLMTIGHGFAITARLFNAISIGLLYCAMSFARVAGSLVGMPEGWWE